MVVQILRYRVDLLAGCLLHEVGGSAGFDLNHSYYEFLSVRLEIVGLCAFDYSHYYVTFRTFSDFNRNPSTVTRNFKNYVFVF